MSVFAGTVLICGLGVWKFHLMLRGFIDDSGSHQGASHFVLAGYILPYERWTAFIVDWERALKKKPLIKYFKMAEAESGEGEFRRVDAPFRKMKVRDLTSVIEKHQLFGLSTIISVSDWKRILLPRVKPGFESPYFPLFDTIVKQLPLFQLLHTKEPIGSVDFIFDKQGDFKEELAVRIYSGIEDAAPPEIKAFLGATPIFRHDTEMVPLQAADLLAWHRRKNWEYPEIGRRLAATVSIDVELTEQYLLNY